MEILEHAEKEKAERLPDGRWAIKFSLGRAAKARTSLWAKKVTSVNRNEKSGYAFEGAFLKTTGKYGEIETALAPGEMIVAVIQCGSWKHPDQYAKIFFAMHDGVYSLNSAWGSEAEKVKTIYLASEVLDALRKNFQESEIEHLKRMIAEKEKELEELKRRLAELTSLREKLENLKEAATDN
jgi:uncharacterized coiled-coil protein SlyX